MQDTEKTSNNARVASVKHLLVAILILAGLVRFGHLACHRSSPLGAVEEEFIHSDIHAFSQWAKGIAAGDLLCRETYHPEMEWMGPIAPLGTFEKWWGGKKIYHQAPLYAYLLAGSYALSGSVMPLLLVQIGLSLLSIWLIFLLGRHLLDARTGLFAALLAAIFAPAIVLDAIILRASLISSLTLATVYVFLRLRENPTKRMGLFAGLLLGMGLLLKPTWLLLIPLCPLALLISGPRKQWKHWLPPLAGGILLCLLPILARNLTVGAPPLSMGTRGPETIFHANCRHADPCFFSPPPPRDYREGMERAHPSATTALSTAISTWPEEGQLGWWLGLEWRKFLGTLLDYEYPNNTNFYFYRQDTPGLSWLPTFGWYAGLSLVGLVLLSWRSRNRGALLVPLVTAGVLLAGILISFAHGRYRMPLAMLLTLPAGATLSLATTWFRTKKFSLLIPVALSVCLLSWFSFSYTMTKIEFSRQYGDLRHGLVAGNDMRIRLALESNRFAEYNYSAKILIAKGDKAGATTILKNFFGRLEKIGRQLLPGLGMDGKRYYKHVWARAHKDVADLYEKMGDRQEATRLRKRARKPR